MLLRILGEYVAGKVYASAFEVVAHKYILHDLGKDKNSQWSFHWHEHHKKPRKNGMYDDDYFGPLNDAALKEIKALGGALLLHLPLVPFFPIFYATITAHAIEYYVKHYRCHTDVEYAFNHMAHHVKHHLVDQNKNWGVTSDWVDRLIGTATKVDPEEWERLREFYTKRSQAALPRIEAAAAERQAEYDKKIRDSLESITDKLYSFLPEVLKSA